MAGPRIGKADLLGFRLSGRGVTSGARDVAGRFASLQVEIQDAHRRMALELQDIVASQFKRSLERKAQRPTRYLEKALMEPDAVRWNVDGFLFLPEGFLDRSQARFYWRHIEKGTRIFVGREMRGFFRSLEGGIHGPQANRRGKDPFMPQIGPTFGSRQGNQQTKIPVGSSTYGALQARVGRRQIEQRSSFDHDQNEGTDASPFVREVPLLNRRQVVNGSKGQGFPIVIKNPIRPHRFLELGIDRFVSSKFIDREYARALAKFGMYHKGVSEKGNVVATR